MSEGSAPPRGRLRFLGPGSSSCSRRGLASGIHVLGWKVATSAAHASGRTSGERSSQCHADLGRAGLTRVEVAAILAAGTTRRSTRNGGASGRAGAHGMWKRSRFSGRVAAPCSPEGRAELVRTPLRTLQRRSAFPPSSMTHPRGPFGAVRMGSSRGQSLLCDRAVGSRCHHRPRGGNRRACATLVDNSSRPVARSSPACA